MTTLITELTDEDITTVWPTTAEAALSDDDGTDSDDDGSDSDDDGSDGDADGTDA